MAAESRRRNCNVSRYKAASCNVASGDVASVNVASGNVASGNVASGNVASGNVASGNASRICTSSCKGSFVVRKAVTISPCDDVFISGATA